MNTFASRGFGSFLMSLVLVWAVFTKYGADQKRKYQPYISSSLLPAFILGTILLIPVVTGQLADAAKMTLSLCFGIFLHISVYYVFLILILPALRKHFSARTCAILWLIPNYLYLLENNLFKAEHPWLVLHFKNQWVWILFFVWLAGFILLFSWKMISHFIFYHQILREAAVVDDPKILEIWQKELEQQSNEKLNKVKIVISKKVNTPLSVGLFAKTKCVVLPENNYSQSELTLIFRHELIHICREDTWSKFFLTFCTAMCWFNPLMWIAMRQSANDLELSCDETVLLGTDESTRRQYANLILNTAGNERGFTTCLSTSASSLRYRLKNMMKPKKRYSGALVVGLIFFGLSMTYGYVSLAYESYTGKDVIYQSGDISQYALKRITKIDDESQHILACNDEKAFHAYMSELTMEDITGNYSFSDFENSILFIYETPKGTMGVELGDQAIKIVPLHQESLEAFIYYLPNGVDWDYLDTIFSIEQ